MATKYVSLLGIKIARCFLYTLIHLKIDDGLSARHIADSHKPRTDYYEEIYPYS